MKTNKNERQAMNVSKNCIVDVLETLELNKGNINTLLYMFIRDQLTIANYQLSSLKMVGD
ncbi:MAG: hypothetical protein II849_07635 [Bacteroidales bacterium]|nr:hypothetical protein [Bacteroidales bacterium]